MKRIEKITILIFILFAFVPVALAQSENERILWRFEMPSNLAGAYTAVGADGTIYTTDNLRLYAVNPGGSEKWSLINAGGGRPITFANDGTIYTGTASVSAVNPDGTIKWVYRPPDRLPWAAGPNVGPDGNIYTMQETLTDGRGLGAFAVNANGKLLWSNRGNPNIGIADLVADSQVVFGMNRLFAGNEFLRGSGANTWAFRMDGQQEWFSGVGDLDIASRSFPRMMADGRIVFIWGQVGLMAVQQDGTVDWIKTHPKSASNVVMPVVGPDGSIYSGDYSGIKLWSLNPDGSTRWAYGPSAGHLDGLFISPDNRVLVATGNGGFGQPGWVRGYDPHDGALLWQVDLDPEQNLNQAAVASGVGFSQDNSTVYLTSGFLGAGVGHTYLYAIRIDNNLSYTLGITNLVGGSDAVFTITKATPNREQFIVYSLRGFGSTFVPQLNVTLDLAKPILLTSGLADGMGNLDAIVHIPSKASGRKVWFQGAELNNTTAAFSEVVQ